jgi:hypothetical protein
VTSHATAKRPGERTCEVTRQQKSVTNARLFAWQALAESDPACREAAAMAVQEFAENLSKYGTSDGTAGTIALLPRSNGVRIRVNNFACSREDGQRVKELIADINAAPDIGELYCRRQRELFENPSLSRVRLGLLRVAFEGGFRLSCSYEHPLLEIVAERS